MTYAGFWHRLGSSFVDALLFAPLCVLSFWAIGEGATVAVLVSAVVSVAYYAYNIIGHAVWGQTIGKRLAGIRVRSVGGAPITWAIAFRRSSVDIAIGVLSLIGYAIVLTAIPDADYSAKGWQQISEQYDRTRPTWVRAVEYGYWIWLASEVFTVLLNSRPRRWNALFRDGTLMSDDAQLALAFVEIEPYRIHGGWPPGVCPVARR